MADSYSPSLVWHCLTHYRCCLAWYVSPGQCSEDRGEEPGGFSMKSAPFGSAVSLRADLDSILKHLPLSLMLAHVLMDVGPSPSNWRPQPGDMAPPLLEWELDPHARRHGLKAWADHVQATRSDDVPHLASRCYSTCVQLAKALNRIDIPQSATR